MLILLGPQPRPALGGPYHLNGEERRYAEAVERRERVRQVLEIRETTVRAFPVSSINIME